MSAHGRIMELVREGRVTPAQAAGLIELRRQLAWRRLPWYRRLLIAVWRTLWSW